MTTYGTLCDCCEQSEDTEWFSDAEDNYVRLCPECANYLRTPPLEQPT